MTEIPAGIRDLYPYLYDRPGGSDALLAEVAASACAKVDQIIALRRRVAERDAGRIAGCAADLAARFAAGARLYSFGNGGSSTDAQDLATTFLHPSQGPPLPAMSLTGDVAVVTALSNDIGFETVFARQIAALGRRGDIAIGLSTSGGSANVVNAIETAARRGMLTVALAGYDGGRLAGLDVLDHLIVIPASSVHRIQEAQTTVYHVLAELTREALIRDGGAAT